MRSLAAKDLAYVKIGASNEPLVKSQDDMSFYYPMN
jgi:hypothetical protein